VTCACYGFGLFFEAALRFAAFLALIEVGFAHLFWFIPPLYSFYALFAFVFTSGIFTSCLTKLFVYALFSTTIRKLLAVKQTFFHSRRYFDLIALI